MARRKTRRTREIVEAAAYPTPMTQAGQRLSSAIKEDRGAALFWAVFSNSQAEFERLESMLLRTTRAVHDLQRRVREIEEALPLYRSMMEARGGEAVQFTCISCPKTFDLPLREAVLHDFATVCPACGSWAFPAPAPEKVLSAAQIASSADVPVSKARTAIHTEGIKPLMKGAGNGNGYYYARADAERIIKQLRENAG